MAYITHGGKPILIMRHPVTTKYYIKFEQGGELPQDLQGIFTRETFAVAAINAYLERTKDNGKGKC